MAGKLHPSMLLLGSSGCGKSTYLDALLTGLVPKARYVVVLNTTSELSKFALHREFVNNERAARPYDPKALAAFIRHYQRVHFEVAARDPSPFLDALGEALMLLGVYESPHCEVLFVTDESHIFKSKRLMRRTPGMARVHTEGRKFGLIPIDATQQMASSGDDTIDHVVIRMARQVIVFPLQELNERQRVKAMYPELPDTGDLAFPEPERGWGPEYLIVDRPSGRKLRITRRADGSRHAVQIGGVRA